MLKKLFIVIWYSGFDVFILCFLFQVSNHDSRLEQMLIFLVSCRELRSTQIVRDAKTISTSNDRACSFINRNYLTDKCIFSCLFFILVLESVWEMLCFLRGSNQVNPMVKQRYRRTLRKCHTRKKSLRFNFNNDRIIIWCEECQFFSKMHLNHST